MNEMEISKICPRCNKYYSEYPALSRVDNKTKICSECGTSEAMFEFTFYTQRQNLNKHDLIDSIQYKIETLIKHKINLLKESLQYKHHNNIINELTLRIEQIENSD